MSRLSSKMKHSLTFDDVLLIPNHSNIMSRSHVDIRSRLLACAPDGYRFDLDVPIIASPMDTVCEAAMCIALAECGAIGILHRYNTLEQQMCMLQDVISSIGNKRPASPKQVMIAIGASDDGFDRARQASKLGCTMFCIDVAHGDHLLVGNIIEKIRASEIAELACSYIMAGSVATASGARYLARTGADAIRTSVGGGSICSTRIVTGFGNNTLQAVLDIRDSFDSGHIKVDIIADGGIRNSGDAMKCFVAGANAIICGSLLAGTLEAPGEIFNENGMDWKVYRGMASGAAMGALNTANNTSGKKVTAEGIVHKVPYRGSVKDVISEFAGGLRSACSYAGTDDLQDIIDGKIDVEMVRISESGLRESQTHILNRK